MDFNQIFTKIKNTITCWLFAFCLIIFSCDKGAPNIPQAAIPEDKMVLLLKEVHLAEALVQMHTIKDRDSIASVLYNKIFDIHQVVESDFYQSINVYNQQPVVLARIYDSVIGQLEARGEQDFKAEELQKKMEKRNRNTVPEKEQNESN